MGGEPEWPAAGDEDELVAAAQAARQDAHAPYSGYRVGAALRAADGEVYTGFNVENMNYSNTVHAEEMALSAALQHGCRDAADFDAILVVSDAGVGVAPCGLCRQTLNEFVGDDFSILIDDNGTMRTVPFAALLPRSMDADAVRDAHR